MAAGHGGPRTPAKPAHVSGPGKYSKRTDGKPGQSLSAAPDQAYGDKKAQIDSQRIAPMGAAEPMAPAAQAAQAQQGPPQDAQPQQMAPFAGGAFNAPSDRPNEPITHGVDIGPGAGPEALGVPPQGQRPDGYLTGLLGQMSAADRTGTAAKLYEIARQRGV